MFSIGRTRLSALHRLLVLIGALFVLSHVAFSQSTSGVTGIVSELEVAGMVKALTVGGIASVTPFGVNTTSTQ